MDQTEKMVSSYSCSSQEEKWEIARHESHRNTSSYEWTHARSWEIYHPWRYPSIWPLWSSCYDHRLYLCISYDSSLWWDCGEDHRSTLCWYSCTESSTDISGSYVDLSPTDVAGRIFHARAWMDTWREDRLPWSDRSDRRRVWCIYRYVT